MKGNMLQYTSKVLSYPYTRLHKYFSVVHIFRSLVALKTQSILNNLVMELYWLKLQSNKDPHRMHELQEHYQIT